MMFLTACSSNPEIKYKTEYIEPPKIYLEPCQRDIGDGTIKQVIVSLDNTIRCYETKQDSLNKWYQDILGGNDA